jgi:hypothetical protein
LSVSSSGKAAAAANVLTNVCPTPASNETDNTVAIPVDIVVSYSGNISTTVDIWPGDAEWQQGNYESAMEAVGDPRTDTWGCAPTGLANNPAMTFNLSPGESEPLQAWVFLLGALTNNGPHFVPADNLVLFDGLTIDDENDSDSILSGPNAFKCYYGKTGIALFGFPKSDGGEPCSHI